MYNIILYTESSSGNCLRTTDAGNSYRFYSATTEVHFFLTDGFGVLFLYI